MYARPMYDIEPERQNAWLVKHARMLEAGIFKPRMTRQLDLWDLDNGVRAAHKEFEQGTSMGKISLTVSK